MATCCRNSNAKSRGFLRINSAFGHRIMNETPDRPPESLRLRKTVWWLLLFASAGMLLVFVSLFLLEGMGGFDRVLRPLFFIALALAITSGFVLRHSYRMEPANFSGFWHLSLSDLLMASFFTALLMTAFRAIWPGYMVPIGIFVSLVFGAGFAFCLLLAARNGCADSRLKCICALGYMLSSAGFMATGMFVMIVLYISFFDGRIGESAKAVVDVINIFSEIGNTGDRVFFNIVRAGIVAIPAGYFMRRWIAGKLKPRQIQAPASPGFRPD